METQLHMMKNLFEWVTIEIIFGGGTLSIYLDEILLEMRNI
jgi:hypothetical protein